MVNEDSLSEAEKILSRKIQLEFKDVTVTNENENFSSSIEEIPFRLFSFWKPENVVILQDTSKSNILLENVSRSEFNSDEENELERKANSIAISYEDILSESKIHWKPSEFPNKVIKILNNQEEIIKKSKRKSNSKRKKKKNDSSEKILMTKDWMKITRRMGWWLPKTIKMISPVDLNYRKWKSRNGSHRDLLKRGQSFFGRGRGRGRGLGSGFGRGGLGRGRGLRGQGTKRGRASASAHVNR